MLTAHISFLDGSGKKGVAPATISGERHCVFLDPVISQVARICVVSSATVSSRIRPISGMTMATRPYAARPTVAKLQLSEIY